MFHLGKIENLENVVEVNSTSLAKNIQNHLCEFLAIKIRHWRLSFLNLTYEFLLRFNSFCKYTKYHADHKIGSKLRFYYISLSVGLDGVWREMSGGVGEIFLWKMEKNANFARYF